MRNMKFKKLLSYNKNYSPGLLILYLLFLSLLISLFSGGNKLCAQEVKKEGHWYFMPSLSLYEQYTDNIDLNYQDEVGAFITEFSPGLLIQYPSPRKSIRLITKLKLDHRARDDGEKETLYWYNLWGYWGHQYSPRTTYELNAGYDIYYTEKDLSSPFVNVFDALTRSTVFNIKPSLSYDITKTTNAKLGLQYALTEYELSDALDREDMGATLFTTQSVGSRIKLGLGYSYYSTLYDNGTGYTENQIPIDVFLDLTYIQLKISTAYIDRTYEKNMTSPTGEVLKDQKLMLYGISFDLGGQLFKLRSTSVELYFKNSFYDDLYGFPYENQETRLGVYHALKKYDFYTDLKYGINKYFQSNNKITYWGGSTGLKWYASDRLYANGAIDYTDYQYDFEEEAAYDVITANIDCGYRVYDWLNIGAGYGLRRSTSDVPEGDYIENSFALFAVATW